MFPLQPEFVSVGSAITNLVRNISARNAGRQRRREVHRAWEKRNPDKVRAKAQAQYRRKKNLIDSLKCPCIRCGESHKACIDFHHRDPNSKRFNIAEGARAGHSRKAILKEVKKCDTLCRNCHAKLHFEEQSGNYANNTA